MTVDREKANLRYRRKVLPGQLDLARRRYQHLLVEAERLGMRHLIQGDER